MKKIWIVLVLIVLLLTGCKKSVTSNHYLEISYKTDRHDSFGIFAAEYKNKIYYFSDEGGSSGIYQMNLDGSNRRLCISCSDINGMQVIDDSIYLLELQEITNENKSYNVVTYSLDGKFIENAMDNAIYNFYADDKFNGISKFFIDEFKNTFFNISTYDENREIVTTSTYYQKGSWKPIGQFLEEITNDSIKIQGASCIIQI